MRILVNEHKCEIDKSPVNEKEINITKCEFEFSEEITNNYVKDVYFTLNGNTIKVANIQNNQCDIPYEVLVQKGMVEIGVVAYLVENEQEIKRYNPSPVFISTLDGSLKDKFDNYEAVTPTDKEQIEQMLNNIDIDGEKIGGVATITITKKDGTQETLQIEDGMGLNYNWIGTSLGIKREDESSYSYVDLKGDKGEAGAIKFEIVAQLPATGADDTIYLSPIPIIEVTSLPATGEPNTIYLVTTTNKRYVYQSEQWIEIANNNNYYEYVYINNNWELLGEIGVQIDLSDYYTKQEVNNLIPSLVDYVKNTDYATTNVGGVIKISDNYLTALSSGFLRAKTIAYSNYGSADTNIFISKGTLENVITGKGLLDTNKVKSAYSTTSGDIYGTVTIQRRVYTG